MSTVAVLFGGPSPEHDISILTGLQAGRVLAGAGRSVTGIYWAKNGSFHQVSIDLEATAFVDGVPAKASPLDLVAGPGGGFGTTKSLGRRAVLDLSAVLITCHGGPGEDGTIQGLFDLCGLPYTGPGQAGAALGMDKLAFAGAVAAAGLPCLPRVLLTESTQTVPFTAPYIVKPRFGGSSIGIQAGVADLDTAKALLRTSPHLRAGAVIEPYRPDTADLEIAVRTYPARQLSAIARPERSGSDMYTYDQKYLAGGEGMTSAKRELPAQLGDDLEAAVRRYAETVADLCQVRGLARIDFLLGADGELLVNEINTIPGSLSVYLWVEPLISRAQLLCDLVDGAAAQPPRRFSVEGADGKALRSASSIAAKLA